MNIDKLLFVVEIPLEGQPVRVYRDESRASVIEGWAKTYPAVNVTDDWETAVTAVGQDLYGLHVFEGVDSALAAWFDAGAFGPLGARQSVIVRANLARVVSVSLRHVDESDRFHMYMNAMDTAGLPNDVSRLTCPLPSEHQDGNDLLAHLAAKTGVILPSEFDAWDLPDSDGVTVREHADEYAERTASKARVDAHRPLGMA